MFAKRRKKNKEADEEITRTSLLDQLNEIKPPTKSESNYGRNFPFTTKDLKYVQIQN